VVINSSATVAGGSLGGVFHICGRYVRGWLRGMSWFAAVLFRQDVSARRLIRKLIRSIRLNNFRVVFITVHLSFCMILGLYRNIGKM